MSRNFKSPIASDVPTGTSPFSVISTTKVTNLNADLLDDLESTAFAQNAIKTVAVSGQTNVVMGAPDATLTLIAGTGVTITTNNTAKSVTITASANAGMSGIVAAIALPGG